MAYSPTLVVLIIAILLAESNCQVNNESSKDLTRSEPDLLGSWVSDLFYQALANFTTRNVGSMDCRKQVELYDINLRNYTSWAVRMAESWERRPIGILGGNRYHFGLYDECVNIQYPLRGQYCLSEVKLIPPIGKDYSFNRTEDLDNFGNNHAWNTILGWLDYPDQIQRNILNIGICIPDSCSALDLQISLQNELNKVFLPEQVKAVVKVNPIMCTISGDLYPYDSAYYVTSAFLLCLFMVCCGATIHHFILLSHEPNEIKASEIFDSFFSSFSFIRSSRELLKFDKNNELNSLNGFKVLTMLFILMGHRFMYIAGNPLAYTKYVENVYLHGPNILLTSMNLVDPFFLMSGFLVYLTVAPVFKKAGCVWIKLVSPIVYRVFRILPAYCLMMAITANIVPHLGDGPLWPQKTWDEAEKCKNYWWTNLLFISNLIDVNHQCLIVSWYIACDVQFFVTGIILVYFYMKNKKFGIGILSAMLGLSLFMPFIVTFLTKRDGMLKVDLPFLENPRTSITFNESYRPSYMRATPFYTGLALSFILEKLKEKKFKFSPMSVYGGTFVISMICLWIQLYGAIFYIRQRPYYPLEHAIYATFSHCTWTVSFGWVLLCLYTTGYGLLTKLLNNRLMVPLGRLSYSVFLVNLPVMMMSQSSQRLSIYPSAKSLCEAWVYDTFKCYVMALALYFIAEAPFGNLTRQLFGRGQKNKPLNTNGTLIIKTISGEIEKKEFSHL